MMLPFLMAMVCLLAVAAPVGAGIEVTIDPYSSPPGESPEYTCVLNNSTGCIYFVNVILPKGYTAMDTENYFCSVNLTLQNESTDEIISKSFAYSNESGYWVNVANTSSCDGVYGPFVTNCSEGDVTEMCMASTASLHLTVPTASVNGSINISLGALGPIAPGDNMTLKFASGMIRNPATSGYYAWSVAADPDGYSDSGVVWVAPGAVKSINVTPKSASLNISESEDFDTAASDQYGNSNTSASFAWYSTNTYVGTIDTAGNFTALHVGISEVYAVNGGVSSNATYKVWVTVDAPENSTALDNDTNFTLESDNTNVTGDFDVNVSGTVNITAIGNATTSPYVDNGTTAGLGTGYEFISAVIVDVSQEIHNALAESNGTITVRMCVNDTVLDAMGLDRNTVQIYAYNNDTKRWVALPTTRDGNCFIADISDYLCVGTFGLAGKPPSGGSYSGSHGGGGGKGTYPPGWFGTPTVTATPAGSNVTYPPGTTPAREWVTPEPTKKTAMPEKTPAAGKEAPETQKEGLPGFEGVFAIAGLLAIAYVMLRRR